MRDADTTIERLLAGLRDAEPPGGMERRILDALDGIGAREVAASTSLWRPPLRPALAMLLACTVILMVAFTVQQRKHVPWAAVRPTQANGRLEWGTQHFFIPTGGPKAPACTDDSEGSFS